MNIEFPRKFLTGRLKEGRKGTRWEGTVKEAMAIYGLTESDAQDKKTNGPVSLNRDELAK